MITLNFIYGYRKTLNSLPGNFLVPSYDISLPHTHMYADSEFCFQSSMLEIMLGTRFLLRKKIPSYRFLHFP